MHRRWQPLRRLGDITEVRTNGRRMTCGPVTIWVRDRQGPSRAALSVPSRLLGHVGRNRVRRRARAALDEALPPTGFDVLVAVRAGADPGYRTLLDAVTRALRHAGRGEGVG